jgi:LmbE family N-acetylglucosaminyl deacetylase
MLRLLCVTAHPDDEAGSFGGTLLRYQERGVQTFVTCLTPGQAASNRGGAKDDAELMAMRRREFAAACGLLRVTQGEVLDYRDGKLDREDFVAVAGHLTRRIRELRPQVVMTYGTEGAATAHTDHGMASLFTTAAFQWAGRTNRFPEQLEGGLEPYRPQKLYYATVLFTIPERQPVALAPVTTVIDVGAHLETKIKAFAAHTSQNPLLPLFEGIVRQRGPREHFHLANTTTPRESEKETDLFAGVTEQ